MLNMSRLDAMTKEDVAAWLAACTDADLRWVFLSVMRNHADLIKEESVF